MNALKERYQRLTQSIQESQKQEQFPHLVDQAGELWSLLAPERYPRTNTEAIIVFSYTQEKGKPKNLEEKLFHDLMRWYWNVPHLDQFVARVTINPYFLPEKDIEELWTKEDNMVDWAKGTAIDTSFCLGIWSPAPPQFPHDRTPHVLEIKEFPEQEALWDKGRPYRLHIFGDGPTLYNGKLDWELVGFKEQPLGTTWDPVTQDTFNAQIDTESLAFRQRFASTILQTLTNVASNRPIERRTSFDRRIQQQLGYK